MDGYTWNIYIYIITYTIHYLGKYIVLFLMGTFHGIFHGFAKPTGIFRESTEEQTKETVGLCACFAWGSETASKETMVKSREYLGTIELC